jgi:AAA15 family ATPase/GTPase
MVAAKLKSENKALDESNIFEYTRSVNILKTAAIYGANASGKSNFVKAISFMRSFVINSSKESQAAEDIDVDNFRLSSETENMPSFFEVIFSFENIRYRYGFELDNKQIHSEWLFRAKQREINLFSREKGKITHNTAFKEGFGLEEKTRDNALFLSVCAQFNGEISTNILKWFMRLGIISGIDDLSYRTVNHQKIDKSDFKKRILSFIHEFDLGISDFFVKSASISEDNFQKILSDSELVNVFSPLVKFISEQGVKETTIQTTHKKYDIDNNYIGDELFELDQNESDGTRKAFFFAGPLLDTLEKGTILIVDELDARFHPMITCSIIQLFHDKSTNPHNAQLIFATHDTNLLDNQFFRRDQIWFAEKNRFGATDLYSLADFKIRNDSSFKKDYISGKYGAIPFIGGLKRLEIK